MNPLKKFLYELQEISVLIFSAFVGIFTRPRYFGEAIRQMDIIGVGSLPIVLLTGFFTGGVLVLQTYPTFEYYGAQSAVGQSVGDFSDTRTRSRFMRADGFRAHRFGNFRRTRLNGRFAAD